MKPLITFARVVISVATLGFVVLTVDVARILEVLKAVAPLPIAAALIAFLIGQLASAVRFKRIVYHSAGKLISVGRAVQVHFVGLLFNQVLPSAIGGDVVKGALVHRELGLGVAVRSTILDRFFGLLVLLLAILLLLALYQLEYERHELTLALGLISGLSVVSVVIVMCIGDSPFVHADRVILKSIGALVADLLSINAGRALTEVGAISCLIHVIGILVFALVGWSVNVDIGLMQYVLLAPLVFLVSVLPISVAGWGVREVGAIEIFGLAGASPEVSVAMSLAWGVLMLVCAIPGAVMVAWVKPNVGSPRTEGSALD